MSIFRIVFSDLATLFQVTEINYMLGILAFALVVYGVIIILRGRG